MPGSRPDRGSPAPSWWTWSCVCTAGLSASLLRLLEVSVAAAERWVSHPSKPEERGYAEKLLLPEGGPSIHEADSSGVQRLSDTLTDPAQAMGAVLLGWAAVRCWIGIR